LQVLNGNQNIYFNEDISQVYIENTVMKSSKYKKPHIPSISPQKLVENDEIPDHDNLLITSFSSLKINLSISQIHLTKSAKQSSTPQEPIDMIRPKVRSIASFL
jgi:hypothetical protein